MRKLLEVGFGQPVELLDTCGREGDAHHALAAMVGIALHQSIRGGAVDEADGTVVA